MPKFKSTIDGVSREDNIIESSKDIEKAIADDKSIVDEISNDIMKIKEEMPKMTRTRLISVIKELELYMQLDPVSLSKLKKDGMVEYLGKLIKEAELFDESNAHKVVETKSSDDSDNKKPTKKQNPTKNKDQLIIEYMTSIKNMTELMLELLKK